jgi:glutathione S-transferase
MIELFIEKVFVPEAKRSVQVIDKCLGKLKGLNDYLNQSLSGRNYLVNHEFSLADLNVASVAKINSAVGIDISEFSNLDQWLNRILERKSALKVAEMATK